MTRKDYERLAAAIREAGYHILRDDAPADGAAIRFGIDATAKEIAASLARDNPRFNRERFLKACEGKL